MFLPKRKLAFKVMKKTETFQYIVLTILITASIAVILLIHLVVRDPRHNSYQIEILKIREDFVHRNKTILLFNSFFNSRNWYLPEEINGPKYFEGKKCPVTNCIITSNHDLMPSLDLYDAVLFHYLQPIPAKIHKENRRLDQLYVFFVMESPMNTKHDICTQKDFYNLTMTYRLDSDLLAAYGGIEDIETGAKIAPKFPTFWRKPKTNYSLDEEEDLLNRTAVKRKMAGWFVSNCNASSGRDNLTKALQQFIAVDVYGRCGPFKCPRSSDKCNQLLDNEYKFYFSFENSLCVDYVTEKFYHALERFIIPVVYGGANYDLFAPPHSYINANDYETAEDLAKYLKYLNDNPKEYIKYFWWKKYYKVVYKSLYCDLCTRLNNPAAREKTQYYKEIKEWWYGNACYDKPKIKFD